MEGKIMFWFDKEGDVLDISIGKPRVAISKELGEDIIVRIDPKKKEVVGFTILNFTKRFESLKEYEKIDLPLKGKIVPASS
jgi:uncharacterized protein YuzE